MINQTFEINKSITNILCDDIISIFLLENNFINKYNKNYFLINDDKIIKMNDSSINYFDFKQFEIPKNSLKWNKIESILYKQLLINLKNYKDEILQFINSIEYNNIYNDYNEFNIFLNNKIFLKSFFIQEYKATNPNIFITDFNKQNSRYNIITFIFFLNDDNNCEIIITNNNTGLLEKKDEIIIKPKKGKLVLFSENMNYQYKYKLSENSIFLITGQLYYQYNK